MLNVPEVSGHTQGLSLLTLLRVPQITCSYISVNNHISSISQTPHEPYGSTSVIRTNVIKSVLRNGLIFEVIIYIMRGGGYYE